jgi:hypothetical protein
LNIARLFSAYRILERELSRERVRHRIEVVRLKAELQEWQNRAMEKHNVRPLYKPEPKPTIPAARPPVGITAKREYMANQNKIDNEPSAEAILAVAERTRA